MTGNTSPQRGNRWTDAVYAVLSWCAMGMGVVLINMTFHLPNDPLSTFIGYFAAVLGFVLGILYAVSFFTSKRVPNPPPSE